MANYEALKKTIEKKVEYFYYVQAQGKYSPSEETRFIKEDHN